MSKPTMHYFPIRGKAEVAKLVMVVAKTEFDSLPVADFKDMSLFPFCQLPRFTDDKVDIVQSNAIIRYLARKHDLYGKDIVAHAAVDTILDAVEDMRAKYVDLIYGACLADAAKAAFWAKHIAVDSVKERNNGVHLMYLNNLLVKNGGKHFASGSLTVADLAVYDMVDLLNRIWGAPAIGALYPELEALVVATEAEPSIKVYLASPLRSVECNGNGLGN